MDEYEDDVPRKPKRKDLLAEIDRLRKQAADALSRAQHSEQRLRNMEKTRGLGMAMGGDVIGMVPVTLDVTYGSARDWSGREFPTGQVDGQMTVIMSGPPDTLMRIKAVLEER